VKLKILLVAVMLTAFFCPVVWSEENWLTNLDEGLKKAKEVNKRVLVDFTATWCGWCTKLKNEVFEKDEFQKYSGDNLILVSIDADQNKELVDKYKVEGFPTVLILSPDGQILEQIVGFKNLESFMEVLKKTEEAAKKPTESPAKK